ncbi:Gfo/Idh/MocA family protein [Calycomorphotria hydatis]|uniref:Inositol 2-dehydrogenase n=1 Tax=Calycomorphotria hydatis TaxID=2528027 RepID=A0A517TD67_9PLAN|nr:Gfo/Idh/MocA family oxidoreductase [Calycomorphotria hydatis]QDT66315.1 Inositol 2-dehydrogenase [Calycomorphotria hydatis]
MAEEISNVSRRTFLEASAAVSLAASFVPATALGKDDSTSASERINLGVIGIGPRCRYVLAPMLNFDDVRCVAIADVQQSRRDEGKKMVDDAYGDSSCQLYSDFRELLGRKDIDAVLIATGDRWHAAASMMAAEAGKDVYSEKPCGITIKDCQDLSDTIARTGRVFQAGTQRRSLANYEQAVKLAHSGKLGKLKTLHASIYTPTLDNTWLPAERTPEPEVCDWNMWLGPAAWRPYNAKYVQRHWRGQWDFDSGARVHDWGAHTVDLCQWANQADDTLPVEYEPFDDKIVATYANGVQIYIHFLKDPFRDRSPQFITRLGTCPVRFEGEEGWVETGDEGEIVTSSPALQKEVESVKRVRGLDVATHARNFFDCMRTRELPAANHLVMRHSHIACHAAAAAWILGRKVQFDPKTEEYIDCEEANMFRSRPSRDWENV